jgi:hypothetical protein
MSFNAFPGFNYNVIFPNKFGLRCADGSCYWLCF